MREILCFGDSNTYGLIPGTKERYGRDIRWTGILADRLYEENYRIVEEGLCGRTTVFEDELRDGRKGIDLLPVLLESHAPIDRIILMLGTNDCKSFYNASAEVIGMGIEKLLQQIRNADQNIKILLISPIWLGEGVWQEGFDPEFNENSVDVSKKLKKVYRKIADKNGCDFLAASDVAEASETDREHLDSDGHKKLAEAILKMLETAA